MNLNDKTMKFGILGGDLRQVSLANSLAEHGYPVTAFFFDDAPPFHPSVLQQNDFTDLSQMDVAVLPLPVSADGQTIHAPFSSRKLSLEGCFDAIHPRALVFGGKVSPIVNGLALSRGISILDYLEREEFAILNAIPAAEGALELTMHETAATVWHSRCLITGYGRIAKVLARMLLSLGAEVTIAARKESDLAWAKVAGCRPLAISRLSEAVCDQDVIYNTVPSVLFDKALLSSLKKECLVIDLASKPGGVDFNMARELGVKTIWALSLPGKVAPITAGNIIRETVINMVTEHTRSQERNDPNDD